MKVKKISLTTKLMVIMAVVFLVSNGTLGVFSMHLSKRSIKTAIQQRMLDIANCAAATVDGDKLAPLTAEDEETPEYQEVLSSLSVYRDNVKLEYIYCIKEETDGSFIISVDPTIEDPAAFGDEAETTDALIKASKGTASVDQEPYTDEWGKFYSANSPVFDSKGNVVSIVATDFSAEWYDDQISSQTRKILLLCSCTLAFSVIVILVLSIRIRKKFVILHEKLAELADGSGELTRKLDITSGDEFESISDSMNAFIDQVRTIVSGIKENTKNSIVSSKDLSQSADSVSETVTKMSADFSNVSAGAVMQTRDVSTASSDIKEITDRLSRMEASVNLAEQYTEDMSRNSTSVSDNFEYLIHTIQDSMKELQQVTEEIGTVGSSVDTVIEVVNVIDDIAGQTNLLSLNASIEAARAGESGRGFAVVADEIGTLATQSNTSASSIKKIMDTLKSESAKAIELVNHLNVTMAEQEKSSSASKQSLSTLLENIESSRKTFITLRNDASAIDKACAGLTNSIESLKNISDSNSDSARKTERSVTEILEISKQVTRHSENIMSLSEKLEKMVGEYKV